MMLELRYFTRACLFVCIFLEFLKQNASQHYSMPVPSQDKLRVFAAGRASGVQMGGGVMEAEDR